MRDLEQFLRFPSISSDPEYDNDCRRAAEFLQGELYRAGLENISLIEGRGHPIVYADWLHADGRPTVLLYGNYDVAPPEPLDEWMTAPFEPTLVGDNLYARGASENKGFTMAPIQAVHSLLRRTGSIPVNVRFLIEGDARASGETLESFLSAKRAEFSIDVAVICDSVMFAPGLPTICIGTRGLVYGEIEVRGARTDLHSGLYGGIAPNPIQGLIDILSQIKGRDGHIRIPNFYDRVKPPSQVERDSWSTLPFDEQAFAIAEVGSKSLVGEHGYNIFERLWMRPTLDVHGIRGGFIGEGAMTVIPAKILAKVSLRLVPDQKPDEVIRQIKEAVQALCPEGMDSDFRPISATPPVSIEVNNRFVFAATTALTEVFGKDPVFVRTGATVPVVSLFDRALNIPSVMLGFRLPDDNLHAPNEKLHLPNFHRAREVMCRLFEIVGTN